jgi:hypothetical protein
VRWFLPICAGTIGVVSPSILIHVFGDSRVQ